MMGLAHLQGFCSMAMSPGWPLFAMLGLMGLASGFTHCAAMCGPLLLTHRQPLHSTHLAAFLGGRTVAYASLGTASTIASRLLVADRAFHIIATVLLGSAALLFAATAFSATRLYLNQILQTCWRPFAKTLYRTLNRMGSRAIFSGPLYPFVLGALLSLMPCGMILGALLAVSATGSPGFAALGMAVFVFATAPGIMLVGIVGSALQLWRRELLGPLQQASLGLSACVFAFQAYRLAL